MSIFNKDPDATLDYVTDWTNWLADSETITSHSVEVESGITLDSTSASDTAVTAWLSGGTAGVAYTVTFRITTNQGRTDDRSINVKVGER